LTIYFVTISSKVSVGQDKLINGIVNVIIGKNNSPILPKSGRLIELLKGLH
jgi:hypothetical protein